MTEDRGLEGKVDEGVTPEPETTKTNKCDIDEITQCPECNSKHLERDYERGELVCGECGLVLDENMIDPRPEAVYTPEQMEKKAHTGPPSNPRLHDKGLGSDISWKNRDAYGKYVPDTAKAYRLRKWQRRIRVANATERNLAFAFSELERMASGMGLSQDVRKAAAVIYRKAANRNLIRGRSIEGVVAASLYGACRVCDVPRTLDEVAAGSRTDRKEIGRTYRHLSRELKLKLEPTSPEDYVSRFCSELKLSSDVQTKTYEILNLAEQKELTSGRGPTGVAAAAIYIASILCNERKTQREVADRAGVTEVTIRNRYKELDEKLELDVKRLI